jgi:hypothetical protein
MWYLLNTLGEVNVLVRVLIFHYFRLALTNTVKETKNITKTLT